MIMQTIHIKDRINLSFMLNPEGMERVIKEESNQVHGKLYSVSKDTITVHDISLHDVGFFISYFNGIEK